MERKVRTMEALRPDGSAVKIFAYRQFFDIETNDFGRERVLGSLQLRLADGTAVRRVDNRTFEITDTAEVLKAS